MLIIHQNVYIKKVVLLVFCSHFNQIITKAIQLQLMFAIFQDYSKDTVSQNELPTEKKKSKKLCSVVEFLNHRNRTKA